MATTTIFLKLIVKRQAVAGDASVPGFESQILVDSFMWETAAEHRSVTKGQNPRTVMTHGQVRLTKVFDRSSTALYGYVREMEKIDSATFTMVDMTLHDGKPLALLEFTARNCYIENLTARAGDSGNMMEVSEDIALSFDTGTLRYYPENPTAPGRVAPGEFQITKSPTDA